MKRVWSTIAGGVLALAMSAPAAHGQTALTIGTGAGGSLPVGNLADGYGIGWNAQANLGLTNPQWPVALRFDFAYHSLSGDEFEGIELDNLRIIAGLANAELYVMRAANGGGLFAVGGAGIYNLDSEGDDDVESTTRLGLLVGAGYKIAMTNLMLSVEAKFHNIFTEQESSQLIPFDVVVEIPLGGN